MQCAAQNRVPIANIKFVICKWNVLLQFVAGTWRKRCSYCIVHRQFTQSKRRNTSYNTSGRCISIGCSITKYWNTKSWISVHLRHELIEIFQFRLWTITTDSKFTQSKYALIGRVLFLFLLFYIIFFPLLFQIPIH